MKLFHKVGSVRHALHAEKSGYDGIYKVIEEIVAMEARGCGLQELIRLLSGERTKEAWEEGNVERAPLMVGQSIGLIKGVLSCKELLDTMAKEAAECLAVGGKFAG